MFNHYEDIVWKIFEFNLNSVSHQFLHHRPLEKPEKFWYCHLSFPFLGWLCHILIFDYGPHKLSENFCMEYICHAKQNYISNQMLFYFEGWSEAIDVLNTGSTIFFNERSKFFSVLQTLTESSLLILGL